MLMMRWYAWEGCVRLVRLVMILRIGLLSLEGVEFLNRSSTFVDVVLVAITRAVVNGDGHSGTAFHPTVCLV